MTAQVGDMGGQRLVESFAALLGQYGECRPPVAAVGLSADQPFLSMRSASRVKPPELKDTASARSVMRIR